MTKNAYDVLEERGYLRQQTHEGLRELLEEKKVPFYIGFDPTADSLHVGHYVQLMVMAHMQQMGHLPIVLLGGGTTMVGDPSGKTDMRRVMSKEEIAQNAERFRKQISRFLDLSEGKALVVNNADWLLNLNYVDFLREIGSQFSVNRMLTAECYKSRLERGLTFLEFNYMLMQAYDFLKLNQLYDCVLQVGGDDQWSNILAGADLIRRKEHKAAYGLTIALLLKSDGKKMGKTESGALWLDPEKTSPYDFYQYWRNVDDADVKTCLSLLTFLPMEEVSRLAALEGSGINEAKTVLAYEVTKQVHGEQAAKEAKEAAQALFGSGPQGGSIPETVISAEELAANDKVIDLLMLSGLTKSRGEGRRLIKGGGISLDGGKVTDEFAAVSPEDFADGSVMIKKGKKIFHKITLQN